METNIDSRWNFDREWNAIVIGDDLLTDGKLASLLGCNYLHPSQLWSLR